MIQSVSRETSERLEVYQELLARWNPKINLVAPSTVSSLKTRHIEDCLQLASLADPSQHWADLGSGGGLPGLVLAIALEDRPTRFSLIESDKRKAAFLRSAVRELVLKNVTVINQRIESVDPLNAHHVSARALAPLPLLMPYLSRHLSQDGYAWLMKGERWKNEVNQAQMLWKFEYEAIPSVTKLGAAILKVSRISHV